MMLKWTPPTLILDTCVLSVGTQHRWFNDHWFKMYTASWKTAHYLHAGALASLQKTVTMLFYMSSFWVTWHMVEPIDPAVMCLLSHPLWHKVGFWAWGNIMWYATVVNQAPRESLIDGVGAETVSRKSTPLTQNTCQSPSGCIFFFFF